MNGKIDRRQFIQAGGAVMAGAMTSTITGIASSQETGRMKKAVGWGMVDPTLSVEDRFRLAKDVGFAGVEVTRHARDEKLEPQVLARASEKIGVPIHGVVNGSYEDLKEAIDDAVTFGANTVLHVVRTSPDGSYMENYRRSQALIRGAVPHAEQKKVKILVENVWATFLIEPLTMARYVDELDSPWVKAYFDIGNVMRWGYPQHWIEVLGKRIDKIHLKEFSLKVAMKEGMSKGFNFPMGQGDIDWAKVREELKKIGYNDWATAEVQGGDRQKLADISQQMDKVLF
jgi:L-ribulose-5-phosphate 3-epimerase